ncbi:MAG: CDGSH iron-sulfur domain-containing protein [Acidobacteriota bacterium]
MSKIHSYEGEQLKIHYDARRCIHAGECVRGNAEAFNPKNRPWVQVDAAEADTVAGVVRNCPTGALTYERKDGGGTEAAPAENTVRLEADGPVYLAGDLEITDAAGNVTRETRAALCRCGASHSKPYCDGQHSKAEFQDVGAVGTAKTKDAKAGATTLKVRILADGPILLDGPYRLANAEGEICMETGSGALCRCGASKNKPFCDGQHKPAGFEDPGLLPT